MKNIGLFLILLRILSVCQVSPANAQQPIGRSPTLDQLNPTMVLRGDPDLISRFKGRVVIISPLRYGHSLKLPKLSPEVKRVFGNGEIERFKEDEKLERPFRRALERLHDRLKDNPNILCVGTINKGPIPPDASPRPNDSKQQAGEIDITIPLIESQADRTVYGEIITRCRVMIFTPSGRLCYNGRLGSDSDKAIREALKELER